METTVSVEEMAGKRPPEFSLSLYPNPFKPVTSIRFAFPRATGVVFVVYPVPGREVT